MESLDPGGSGEGKTRSPVPARGLQTPVDNSEIVEPNKGVPREKFKILCDRESCHLAGQQEEKILAVVVNYYVDVDSSEESRSTK